jgi:hypothetical protein
MRRVAWAGAVVCGAGALSGCAVGVPSRAVQPAALSPVAVVSQVADSARATRSASYGFTFSGPMATAMSGHGVWRSSPKAEMDLTLDSASIAGIGGLTGFEERLVDGSLYLKVPTFASLGGKWLKMPADGSGPGSGLGDLLPEAQADPSKQLQLLLSAPDVRVVGAEVLDGVPTTHYAGDVTVADIEKNSAYDPATRAALGKLYAAHGGQVSHFDVWVDSTARARKFTTSTPTPLGTFATSITVSGYDRPITISAPDPADIFDHSDLAF